MPFLNSVGKLEHPIGVVCKKPWLAIARERRSLPAQTGDDAITAEVGVTQHQTARLPFALTALAKQ